MVSPHQVTRDFEAALCEYTGAKYAVAVNSCTAALLLACKWNFLQENLYQHELGATVSPNVTIPKHTYVSVPQSIIHAGCLVKFEDLTWYGHYQLKPYPVWDYARQFTSSMYEAGQYQCVSFHWNKILGIQQGGAILHDNEQADAWFRRARFDGRTEGVPPNKDRFTTLGYHCYMSPEVAAEGLMRLSNLPKYNHPLPNDDYPDLSLTPWNELL